MNCCFYSNENLNIPLVNSLFPEYQNINSGNKIFGIKCRLKRILFANKYYIIKFFEIDKDDIYSDFVKKTFIKGDIMIFIYDLMNKDSFKKLKNNIKTIRDCFNIQKNILVGIFDSKIINDNSEEKLFCEQNNITYFTIDIKRKYNINEFLNLLLIEGNNG